ncbi:SpoIIE family protein phosphatase [Paracrocinitomix mangrovi]|uniref:7TM diverse intracellular signaling domain-containing protein n=1 Tax=Paracrocinitomix mangrovi TaxID=2862509 RepID=UPI001C8DB2D3|nr:7TM diverse intracellular signaling domain-containing protein [Paracrocinitomix mangrovi]UKN01339.1 SpoIIE family protein phosphatase [Paracrocinitomix mangrovi]
MGKILLWVSLFLSTYTFGQKGVITLTDENLGNSFAKDVLLIEDQEHQYELADVQNLPDSSFSSPSNDIPNLDFTTSSWWMKFSVTNNSSFSYFILETARPITNKVEFYEVRGENVENAFVSGDDLPYENRVVPHNLNLFPITIYPTQTKHYYVRMVSDGEVITLPVKIQDKMSYFERDATQQYGHGFYYGMMYLITVIYFFFFLILRDRTFLFYIIYVATQAFLQLGLDGYAYRYLFPSGGYMANHFILLIAGVTVFSLFNYVISFLNLAEKDPRMNKVLRGLQVVVAAVTLMSLIPGKTYEIGFPVINGISLLSMIASVFVIFRLIYRKEKVDISFAIAFIILILGAIVFILGNFNIVGDAVIAQNALKISSALEVTILSLSMSNKYRRLQEEKEEAQKESLKQLQEKNELMDDINIKLEKQVKDRTAEIERQKEELATSNEEILSSIHYAKRIQEAILPSDQHVKNLLPESFVLYTPKDVVSGDFYFVEKTTTSTSETELVIAAAVDCTGHGVPGAFMSIVGNNYLTASLTEAKVNDVAAALNFLNEGVVNSLRQNKGNKEKVRDGMDIALVAYDKKGSQLYFAGAKNPVYIVREVVGEDEDFKPDPENKNPLKAEDSNLFLKEIKGDSHPIGAYIGEELKPFNYHAINVQKGDMIYIFSDGYADQFGGPDGKKYKYKNFKKFLLSIANESADVQKEKLQQEYERWRSDFEQIDDVLVMGFRVV